MSKKKQQENFIKIHTDKLEALKITTVDQIQVSKKEIEDFVANTKKNLSLVQIEDFAKFFSVQKVKHTESARYWLGGTILCFFLTLLFFINLPTWQPQLRESLEMTQLFYLYSSRILTLAFGVGASLWCANYYRREKNLQTIYAHKEVSINSYKAFVLASDSTEIKDAILLETTKAVFSLPNSGYAGKDDSLTMVGKLLDMLKSVKSIK